MKGGKKKGIGRGSKVILLLAMATAAITGFGFYQYANTLKTTVYLYHDGYPQGTKATKEMFVPIQMDTSACNAMAGTGNRYMTADDILRSIEQGDCLLVSVAKHTVASTNQFVASGGTAIESRLAKQMVSVELPANKVSGLSAGVRIGSRLNVVTGYSLDTSKLADLIFQDLLVVDVVTDMEGKAVAVYVEVEPTESVHLIHAVMFESVTVSILKPGSYVPVDKGQASYKRDYSLDPDGSAYLNSGLSPATVMGAMAQENGMSPRQEVQR